MHLFLLKGFPALYKLADRIRDISTQLVSGKKIELNLFIWLFGISHET